MLFLKMFLEVKTKYLLVHGIHTATTHSKHLTSTHTQQQLGEGQLSIFITSQIVKLASEVSLVYWIYG